MQAPGSGHLDRIWVTDVQRAWAIDDNWQLFQWTGAGAGWQHVDGNYIDVAQAANGGLWTLASDGRIFLSKTHQRHRSRCIPVFFSIRSPSVLLVRWTPC
jgi:hypothetical protein